MAKVSAKNCIVVVGGYVLSTWTTTYNVNQVLDPVDVTGFTDGLKHYVVGLQGGEITLDMLYDEATNATYDRMRLLTVDGNLTLLPEGYTAPGAKSISMPYMQANFNPSATPADTIKISGVKFAYYGTAKSGVEIGQALYHGSTITTTTSGTAVADGFVASDLTSCAAAATLHVWTATASDTYVVTVEHSSNGTTGWSTIMTFAADGKTLTSERQEFAAAALKRYRRFVATRTGAAADTFGFTVHFWRDPTQST